MYIPDSFRITDPVTIDRFIEETGFMTLVSATDAGLFASHLPFLYDRGDERLTITGHIARANPHWQAFDGVSEALAIIHGPDAYVSPTWYETKPANPTWNYAVVHAYGPVTAIEDQDWVSANVDRMTDFYEQRTVGRPGEALPPELEAERLQAIVGFRMDVDRIEAKFKLSQNRPAADRRGVALNLEQTGAPGAAGIARLMREFG